MRVKLNIFGEEHIELIVTAKKLNGELQLDEFNIITAGATDKLFDELLVKGYADFTNYDVYM